MWKLTPSIPSWVWNCTTSLWPLSSSTTSSAPSRRILSTSRNVPSVVSTASNTWRLSEGVVVSRWSPSLSCQKYQPRALPLSSFVGRPSIAAGHCSALAGAVVVGVVGVVCCTAGPPAVCVIAEAFPANMVAPAITVARTPPLARILTKSCFIIGIPSCAEHLLTSWKRFRVVHGCCRQQSDGQALDPRVSALVTQHPRADNLGTMPESLALPLQPPIAPMLAKLTEAIPEGPGWHFEPK